MNVNKGMHGATGCIYVGLPEFKDMSFLLHYLDSNNHFIDIGANVGVYSLLAAGVKNCETTTIEPIPSTFNYLLKNIALNNLDKKITPLNIGLSNKKGQLFFTEGEDTMNHVLEKETNNSINVEVDILDNILSPTKKKNTLIKLDVEGFEYNVLLGGQTTLNNENLTAFIVELNGCGDKFGFEDKMVDDVLLKNGFGKYDYNPFDRKLKEIENFNTEENTLYIRKSKLNEVEEKLKTAEAITIFNQKI
ncbi:MAG: FkbM family methyltransferase [Vicingaceae bacterium]|nr:FkbM family methyltransferase [Vicingaceae bacterium]